MRNGQKGTLPWLSQRVQRVIQNESFPVADKSNKLVV